MPFHAPGLDLLARANAIVRAGGFVVTNVDASVLLERPKLVPHLDEIRGRIARVLGLPIDRVGVKGKTHEGLGAIGRGEAIAAHATAMVTPEDRR